MSDFLQRYGPWAILAGGSQGIGEALAGALCSAGANVVLVARRAEPLERLADSLRSSHAADVRTVAADLSTGAGIQTVLDRTDDIDAGLLIYNAAFSTIQPFLDTPAEKLERAVRTNALAPVLLIHGIGRRLRARGRGGVVLVSSMSAFHGSPMIATYAATKAFGAVLGESLWPELEPEGIDVLVACAGATSTPNFESSRPARGGLFNPAVMSAADVAEATLAALGRKPLIVIGTANRVSYVLLDRILPRRLSVRIMQRAMDRLYGPNGRPDHMFAGSASEHADQPDPAIYRGIEDE